MSNRLLVNPGTPQAWEITLRPGINRIGRGPENDFTINHQSVSTHHCEITVSDQTVTLKDLGSTNGTFVERVPVTETKLYPGQTVQLGSINMTFEAVGLPDLPDAVNLPGDGAQIMVANPSPVRPPIPPGPATGGTQRLQRPASSASAPPTPATLPTLPISPAPQIQIALPLKPELPGQDILLRGSIGAASGGIAGVLGWCFLINYTAAIPSLPAWGIGALIGGGARLLAKRGSARLGWLCGLCAVVTILLGGYFGTRTLMAKETENAYEVRMAYARSALEAKTDTELRALLAANSKKPAEQISADEIKEFRDTELPELRDFVNGKPSREEFTKGLAESYAAGFSYQNYFFQENLKAGIFMVLFICLGVITAWKIGAGDAAGD